ncbi:molybdopterin-containing oxidoreductase family protein [Aegicerativicinus sediminis]|uniref:molybdopterin-containing oxidoreductase family protein n=1 Tax=Aegicerativicinus sediminis TaxID=2893202 RepID=UPI001E470C56|nr:molybdopterin-dependent oxidoreductase [Aegicerativicinus sediminis]
MDKDKEINRRKFIELGVQGSMAAGILSLPGATLSSCVTPVSKTVNGACYHDCPDTCSWKVTAKDNVATSVKASNDNPYTNGKLCSKMDYFLEDVTYHPDRILTPLKRIGNKGEGKFEPISWDKALAEISTKLKTIIDEDGGEAILPFSYGGNEGLVQRHAISDPFFALLGASQLEKTICGDAGIAGLMAVNGQTTGVLPEDIVHSKYIILWGTNPIISNQHLWPLIQKAKKDGAKIVVIDPFKSLTAKEADWHIQPIPGTDTALALGMLNVIFSEQLEDQEYIENYTSGIEELREHVSYYTPDNVAKISGLDTNTIVTLGKEYATNPPSLIRVLVGLEHQSNGSSAYRAIAMLPAVTGAWRKLGGGLMHMTYELFGESLNWEKGIIAEELLKKKPTRSINMIQFGKALNNMDLNPPIKALFVFNANPVVTIPNQNLVIKGMERPDLLTIVLEHFITDTARYADYVFPATSVIENWDLYISWAQTYVNINEPAITPVGEAKPNSEFFRLLSKAMGLNEPYLYEPDIDFVKSLLNSNHEFLKGITFNSLRKTGWAKLRLPENWVPHEKGNFNTLSGKCMLYNPEINPPLPEYNQFVYSEKEMRDYPFQLLTIKSTKNFLNSSHANINHLRKKEGIPFLDINIEDAELQNFQNGDKVKVYNNRGEVIIAVKVTDKVKKGVVCMPQGYWPSLMENGSSANALTNDLLTDMGRGGAIQEARVNIVKA